jgi:polysaccharide biosynthesis/export protein
MLALTKALVAGCWIALLTLMAGCTMLPQGGPDSQLIKHLASNPSEENPDDASTIPYVLIDINRRVLEAMSVVQPPTLSGTFGVAQGPAPNVPLGVGDTVEVTIFESHAGGLFVPPQAGSRPGNFVTLPPQTINPAGTINVPYAGAVQTAGLTIPQVQTQIETALKSKADEPQVIITLVEGNSNQVSILGDVTSPQQIQLRPIGERVLDVIARAGGLAADAPAPEAKVILVRRGRRGTVGFTSLINTPRENIFVSAGDVIFVDRQRRTFLAFGASGLNGRVNFEESNLSLAEAVAEAGGLLDERADPRHVFLYRLVPRRRLEGLVDLSGWPDRDVPTIFRADFRDPSSFFVAQLFQMHDKDVIYVSNSATTALRKFLTVLTPITTSVTEVVRAAADVADTGNSGN